MRAPPSHVVWALRSHLENSHHTGIVPRTKALVR